MLIPDFILKKSYSQGTVNYQLQLFKALCPWVWLAPSALASFLNRGNKKKGKLKPEKKSQSKTGQKPVEITLQTITQD